MSLEEDDESIQTIRACKAKHFGCLQFYSVIGTGTVLAIQVDGDSLTR
jgi:hypothetical protein